MITQLQRIKVARRIAVGLLFVFMAIAPMLAIAKESLGAAGQTGEQDSPFTIKNAEELAYFAELVNSGAIEVNLDGSKKTIKAGFEGSYIQLANDIDLNEQNWTPIGTSQNRFKGHFDGNGHVVEGLKIDINDESNNNVYAGLFGCVLDGEIRNLGVRLAKEGITVKSKSGINFGGIVGFTFNTTIRNCYVDAEEGGKIIVKAKGVGGIAGRVRGGTITHCYSTVDIEAKIDVPSASRLELAIGGIAGDNNGTISHCYATGSIIGERGGEGTANLYVGGICGNNYGTLKNNLALNKTLSGKTSVGGICSINRIVGLGGVSVTNNYASPDILVNDQKVNDNANNEAGANTSLDEFKSHLTSITDNEWKEAWVWPDGKLPQLLKIDTNNSYSTEPLGGQEAYYTSDYLQTKWFYDSADAIENDGGNNGLSPQTPIKIETAAELAYFAQQVNAGGIQLVLANGKDINDSNSEKKGFAGYYFALSNNINLQAWEWTPIGNDYNPFCGHFDGKGHEVNGLKIKMDVEGTGGGWTLAGLFGYVLNGTLQNIGVELADEGIEVSAQKGYVYAGGIVGKIDKTTGTPILRHCYVTGGAIKITKAGIDAYAGGITGWGSVGGSLALTHCYATVDVESSSWAGGIAGQIEVNSAASYCFATGNVKANTCSGGICGDGAVSNSLALNPKIEGNGTINRITTGYSNPTSNYASSLTQINGKIITSTNLDSQDGADTWLNTFKDDLINAPGGEGWSDDKGWKWPTAPSNQLPKLAGFSQDQPDIDVASYATDCPRLHIQSPTGVDLTVTDATDTNNTPIADNTPVRPGTQLKLSHTITQDGYSFNHYIYGTSANQINKKIDVDTYVMLEQDVWISASVKYTDPKPDPDPVYPPPTPIYYTVTLPQVEGATTDPEAGIHEVESWNTFRFYLTLDPGYSDSQPIVTTSRGETLVPRQSDGAYLVKYVRSDVEISIDSIRPNLPPVANEAIDAPANRPRIWTEAATLCISMPQTAPASTAVNVFAADGRLLYSFDALPGLNRRQLPRGFYIIRISDLAWKVIIR